MARVDLIHARIGAEAHATMEESEVLNTFQKSKDINILHIEFGYQWKENMQATG